MKTWWCDICGEHWQAEPQEFMECGNCGHVAHLGYWKRCLEIEEQLEEYKRVTIEECLE